MTMAREWSFSPRLRIVLDHLRAVRALHGYITEGLVEKDIEILRNELRRELNRQVLTPKNWEELEDEKGWMYSRPQSKPKKWNVVRGDNIALEVYLATPVGDENDPYVNLYVPCTWRRRKLFLDKLVRITPPSFKHASQFSPGELAEEYSILRFVPYENYLGADGVFKGDRFMKAIRTAAEAVVKLESEIDRILASLR